MKNSQLIEKLRYNWYLKLLCFIAAILIYVFYKSYQVDSKTFIVPLKIIENGAVMSVEDTKSTVKVVVKTDAEHMSLIHSNELSASINLDNITKSGYVTVPVKLEVSEDYLTYDSFEAKAQPESIRVKVEKKDVAYIKLNPLIVGEPAHGYEVSEIFVDPEYVQVEGAESLLRATDYINTTSIDITNAKSNFIKEATPIETNKMLEVLEKGPYKVSVNFVEQKMERTLENIPVYVNGLWPDLEIAGEIPPVTVTLEGSVSVLEAYNLGNNTVVVDLTSISEPGTYDLPLYFYFPDVFEIKTKSLDTVTVTVVSAASETENASDEVKAAAETKEASAVETVSPAENGTDSNASETEKNSSGKKSKSKKGSN